MLVLPVLARLLPLICHCTHGEAGVRHIRLLLVGVIFACHMTPVALADPYISRIDSVPPSSSGYWGPRLLADTGPVSHLYAERGLRFYRPQHEAGGIASGYGVSYQLYDLPFSTWLAERKISPPGMAYTPRAMKVFLTIETKYWGYTPIPSGSARYSDPDVELAGTDLTDRFYQILFNIPF